MPANQAFWVKMLVCSFLVTVAFGACTKKGDDEGDDDDDNDNDDNGGLSDDEVNNRSTWVLVDAIMSLHNRFVAGESCGSEINKVDESCASGGTVTITGTLECGDNQPEERDLTFAFDDCTEAEEGGLITFANGECDMQGQWVEDDYQQLTYSGESSLQLTLFVGDDEYEAEFDDCSFSISEEMNSGEWSYAGLFCGDAFSW